MARVVVLWTRPYHLTAEEAARWARREAGRLLAVDAVEHAELTLLRSVSLCHPRDFDWMLEIHVTAGATVDECVNAAAFTEWLSDLRLLGMHPSVLLAEDGVVRCREGR